MQSFACSEFGWSVEYANNASLISLLLLMRQKMANEGNEGMTLTQQEELEKTDWDTLVKQSHLRYDKYR